jgi:predicted aspartyl protease
MVGLLMGCSQNNSVNLSGMPLADVPTVDGCPIPAVEASINGGPPVLLLLDTGTDPSAVDVAWAKQIGLPLKHVDDGQVTGAGEDKVEAVETDLPFLRVGRVEQAHVYAAALDLSRIAQRLKTDVRGVLGYSYLDGRIVQFDFPGKRVRFYASSDDWRRSGQYRTGKHVTMPFELGKECRRPIVTASVNGHACRAVLDTGASRPFGSPQSLASQVGIAPVEGGPEGKALGYLGTAAFRNGKADDVHVGPLTSHNVSVWIDPSAHAGEILNVGVGFMRNYTVTFDYQHHVVDFQIDQ